MKSLCLLTPSSREGTDESSLSGTSWQPVSTSISGALSECTGDPHGGCVGGMTAKEATDGMACVTLAQGR